jgi:hypothetical protein
MADHNLSGSDRGALGRLASATELRPVDTTAIRELRCGIIELLERLEALEAGAEDERAEAACQPWLAAGAFILGAILALLLLSLVGRRK